MAKYDPQFANSSGYFKDPITGEDLSADMERAVKCELKDGKFIWPMVLRSDGEELLKIVYKYFTEEEKDIYKQYRGRGSSPSTPRQKREPKQKEPEPVQEVRVEREPEIVVKHNGNSTASLDTLMLLAQCDDNWGVSFINGIMYCLVGKRGENKIYHVPRSLIPDEEWDRLCHVN